MKRLLMELLGTFFFILTIAISGNLMAAGAVLMAWIYIGAYVSGAHYNPLISLAVTLLGKLTWHEMAYYWVAQVLGGTAAFIIAAAFGHLSIPHPNSGLLPAFMVELLLSFAFGLVVLVVAMGNKYKDNYIFGFAIGLTLFGLAITGSQISGGLFNPAIAIGSQVAGLVQGTAIGWSVLGMYVGSALLGGYLAAHAYRYFIIEKR